MQRLSAAQLARPVPHRRFIVVEGTKPRVQADTPVHT